METVSSKVMHFPLTRKAHNLVELHKIKRNEIDEKSDDVDNVCLSE